MLSDFSAKVGADSVGDGDADAGETGDAEALAEVAAAGELLASAEGDGAATIGLGGGRCVAVYAYHPMSPRTQIVMAVHACRSISVARRAIHRQWMRPGPL
jgi:hypothetical protein